MAGLQQNHGDGDVKCALTLAQQVGLAGQGGRGDDGGAASELDWAVVQQRRCYAVAELVATMVSSAFLFGKADREGGSSRR